MHNGERERDRREKQKEKEREKEKGKSELRQISAKKKNETAARERGRSPFLIRVQLCEERIKMQLTDQDTRVGVVLDRLRAHCPGYRIDGLFTYDGISL